MLTLTLITVGFLAATAVVIGLARASTARWERDKRASVAARADESTRRTSAAGSAPGGPIAMARAGLAALRDQASRFPPVTVLARLLPRRMKQGTARVRPVRRLAGVLRSSLLVEKLWRGRWTKSRSPAPPADGDGADTALHPEPSRAATVIRGEGVAKAAGRRLFRRTVPSRRLRGLPSLHRAQQDGDLPIPHEERTERPAAR